MQLTNVQAACYLAQAGWPTTLIPTMVAIGHPESGLNTAAVNRDPSVADAPPTGWLQVRAFADRTRQWNLTDPLGNAQAALAVYRSQGLGAWTTYTDGSYRSSLAQVEHDLSGWTPSQCTGSGAASTGASSSPLGIASAVQALGQNVSAGGQVLLGVLVLAAAALLILSQTRAGAGLMRAGKQGARLALMAVK